MQSRLFGRMPDGTPVHAFDLGSTSGLSATIIEYGGRIVSLEVPTATGKRIGFYSAFGERSAIAVEAAQGAGLNAAVHIQGGLYAWKKVDGPIAR